MLFQSFHLFCFLPLWEGLKKAKRKLKKKKKLNVKKKKKNQEKKKSLTKEEGRGKVWLGMAARPEIPA